MIDRQLLVDLIDYFYENGAPPFNYCTFFKEQGVDRQLSRTSAYRITWYIRKNTVPPWVRGDLRLEEKFKVLARRFADRRERDGYSTDKDATDTETDSRPRRTRSRASSATNSTTSRNGKKRGLLVHTDDKASGVANFSPEQFVEPLTPASMQEEGELRYRIRSGSRSMTLRTPERSERKYEKNSSRRRNNNSEGSASSRGSTGSRRSLRLAQKRKQIDSYLPQIREEDEKRFEPQGTPRNRGEKRQKLVESEETFDNFITPPKEAEILEESNNESEDEESESEGTRRKSLVARRLFIDLEEPEVQKQEIQEGDILKELALYEEVHSEDLASHRSSVLSGPRRGKSLEKEDLDEAIYESETDRQLLSTDEDRDFSEQEDEMVVLRHPDQETEKREPSPIPASLETVDEAENCQNEVQSLKERVSELEVDLSKLRDDNLRLHFDLATQRAHEHEDEAAELREEIFKREMMIKDLRAELEKKEEIPLNLLEEVRRERKERKKIGRLLLKSVLDLRKQNAAAEEKMLAIRKELSGLTKLVTQKKKCRP